MSEPVPATLPAAPARSRVSGARRIAIIAIIGSLSITAIVGIITLLTGSFGETEGKIILTTLLIGAFSITSLCHLAVVGRSLRIVGYVGIVVSALALICGVFLIWRDWDRQSGWEELIKAFIVLSVLAVSLAHANLLLLLANRRSPIIRIGLLATVAVIAIVAAMIILPVLTEGEIPGDNFDNYWRVFGVFAILDALGTVVLPVTGIFVRDDAKPGRRRTLSIDPALGERLDSAAAARGVSREQLAVELLEQGLSDEP